MSMKKLLGSVECVGWKLSKMDDGSPALQKTCYVAIEQNKRGQVIGITRYGANDCESLYYLGDVA